jgi:UDP-N-acetylglucosamine enolpyruvyl transferase
MNNYVYSPSVSNLGGIMANMDMTDTMRAPLSYIGPLIATPDNRTVSITGQGYGTSRAEYQGRLSAAHNLGGGIADIAATFNMLDLFLGRK